YRGQRPENDQYDGGGCRYERAADDSRPDDFHGTERGRRKENEQFITDISAVFLAGKKIPLANGPGKMILRARFIIGITMKTVAIIPAGGAGKRLGLEVAKQYLLL